MSHTILIGDAREQLATIPAGTVQTCVTSPPYYGLRDYGTASWDGGDPECKHRGNGRAVGNNAGQRGANASEAERKRWARNKPQKDGDQYAVVPVGGSCVVCGAVRVDNQIGLESTVEDYVQALVDVFREVRRVLKDDGTLWLNLGDSYAAARGGTHQPAETLAGGKNGYTVDGRRVNRGRGDTYNPTRDAHALGLKHKDLIGIPWRVAFALQADGWYLRSEIIWHKPNPMPESVTDRPTKAHEQLFLFSKQPRYFYDAAAIAEPATPDGIARRDRADLRTKPGWAEAYHGTPPNGIASNEATGQRNKRSVWTVSTKPYSGAHFAVFPPKLIEPCILAGTSERGQCRACGAPWVRVVERGQSEPDPTQRSTAHYNTADRYGAGNGGNSGFDKLAARMRAGENGTVTKGWAPSCECDEGPPIPQTVLDPFAGSGTTGAVAEHHGRHAVLIELNPEYADLIRTRLAQRPLWDAMSVAD